LAAAAAITYGDVAPTLRDSGVGQKALEALKALFEECEAGRYAGAADVPQGGGSLPERALKLAKELDRSLK